MNRIVTTIEGGKVTEYLYDNAGNRFVKKGPEGTTLYLRHGQTAVAMDIELPVVVTDVKGKVNRYVLSGELLAGRITKEIKADGTNTFSVSYYHLDHLNSTKCVSDEAGVVEVRYVYRAFGSQLAKIGNGEAKYTYGGKELDGETNLYYFNARYYDAEVGRFISVDPAKDGLNWYSYCSNNPLRRIDPTGLDDFIFNGNKLYYRGDKRKVIWAVDAVSGKGQYMGDRKATNKVDQGPTPEGTYFITLKQGVPTEKKGGGWGRFAVYLEPTLGTKLGNKLTNKRSGFFLHEDGNEETSPGTAGCIGVKKKDDGILKVWDTLKSYQEEGNKTIKVKVDYDYKPLEVEKKENKNDKK